MERRAFSLVELLVVMAILAVLAALLFPVFVRSKERAKLASCASRLRQFAVALNLYRTDHDDRGFVWGIRDDGKSHFDYPFNWFEGMKGYLGDGSTLWCPEPNADPIGVSNWNLYQYPAFSSRRADLPGVNLYVPPRPTPGTVVAYCENHTTPELDSRYTTYGELRKGTYPFVREDASLGMARNEAIRVGYYGLDGWSEAFGINQSFFLRFPGEPWPPMPEG